MQRQDIIVIGGGPAGLTAGINLARYGLDFNTISTNNLLVRVGTDKKI